METPEYRWFSRQLGKWLGKEKARRNTLVNRLTLHPLDSDKLSQNVNSDEAAVLGAAFYGASISHQFKAKVELKLQELTPYTIDWVVNGKGGWRAWRTRTTHTS